MAGTIIYLVRTSLRGGLRLHPHKNLGHVPLIALAGWRACLSSAECPTIPSAGVVQGKITQRSQRSGDDKGSYDKLDVTKTSCIAYTRTASLDRHPRSMNRNFVKPETVLKVSCAIRKG